MVLLEFNEISKKIVDTLLSEGRLPSFKRIDREWAYFRTVSETDEKCLQPWIQWTSVHTGKMASEHEVKNLGSTRAIAFPQIWEVLSNRGIESAVVGSISANRGSARGGFFFPDPWCDKSNIHPPEFVSLWSVFGKLQGHAIPVHLREIVNGLRSYVGMRCFDLQSVNRLLKISAHLALRRWHPHSKWRSSALIELLLADLFKSVLASPSCRFCMLFLNSVAHYQHHFWRNFDSSGFDPTILHHGCRKKDDPIRYGYELYDGILREILRVENISETLILLASGLSQRAFTDNETEGGMNYYRLRNHRAFAKRLGFQQVEVQPLMSRDWRIQNDGHGAATRAAAVLGLLKVEGTCSPWPVGQRQDSGRP